MLVNGLQLKNNTYDVLRSVVQIWLPALAVLYSALAVLWGLPNVEAVVGTLTAFALFLGTILGLSRKNYDSTPSYDGALELDAADGTLAKMAIETDVSDISKKDYITLQILHKSY